MSKDLKKNVKIDQQNDPKVVLINGNSHFFLKFIAMDMINVLYLLEFFFTAGIFFSR